MAGFLSPERTGRSVLGIAWYAQGFFALLRYLATHLSALTVRPTRLVLFKQIYFTGIEALGAVSIIAVLTGIVITTQITSLVGVNATLTAKIMLWVVVRELGPLLTAIVIIARSSSAAASELAGMKIRGELDSLRQMGIEPMDYLIVPRIAGITLSVMAVTFYFQMLAIIAGIGFTALTHGIPFAGTLGSVVSLLTLGEVAASFFKTLVFGLVVSITSCYYGLRAPATTTAIPQAATAAVVRNLLTVFLLDGVITYAVFL
ncbi:MAG: ABC transporter permease [Gammaproteobacteria bacterium]|nr:MAG: ABC transporter permease [Gammaproteobacteria bacterium]